MMRAMRETLSLAAVGALLGLGQPVPAPIEPSALRLHYVQKPIGYERYEIAQDGDALKLTDGRVYDVQALWRSVRFQP
jgi:hypothetical protein